MARGVQPWTAKLATLTLDRGSRLMSKLLRIAAAGYGAKKLGGGCISTVLIFIVLFWLLGYVL